MLLCNSRSGVFVLSNDVAALGKDNSIFAIEKASGANVTALSTSEDVSAALPPSSRPGALTGRSGYINPEGGWAAASDGISKLAEVISSRGVKIQLGKEVTGLAYDAFGGVCGVRVRGHKDAVEADIVIAACGAWTAPTFADPDLQLDGRVIATGYVEGITYKDVNVTPSTVNLLSRCNCLPRRWNDTKTFR